MTNKRYEDLNEAELDELHENYENDAEYEIVSGVVSENITNEQIEQVRNAPAEEDVTLDNMHLPTKKEVVASIVTKLVETKNTKVVITSVEDLKKLLDNIDEEKIKGQLNYSISSFYDIVDKKNRNEPEPVIEDPKILFDFLKSGLTAEESEILADRLLKFKQIFDITASTGQLALHETARDTIINLVKEQEAAAIGHGKYIKETTIEYFRKKVAARNVYYKPFREFPRLIPDNIYAKLKEVQEKGVFDEFWILYLDYNDNSSTVKSTATKIKEKDPILFGKLTAGHVKCFYIADWIDEYCDLTLDKFVTEMHKIQPGYTLPEVKAPTPEEISTMLIEKKRQANKLSNTNRSNYHQFTEEESGTNSTTKTVRTSLLSKCLGLFR